MNTDLSLPVITLNALLFTFVVFPDVQSSLKFKGFIFTFILIYLLKLQILGKYQNKTLKSQNREGIQKD